MDHIRVGSEAAGALAHNLPRPERVESITVAQPQTTTAVAATAAASGQGGGLAVEAGQAGSVASGRADRLGAGEVDRLGAVQDSTDVSQAAAPVSASEFTRVLKYASTGHLPTSATALVALLKVITLLINALTGLQARTMAGLLEARRAEATASGRSLRPVRGAVIQEIAIAARLSPHKTCQLLRRSVLTPVRFPKIWGQWVNGEVSEDRVTAVLREAKHLHPDAARQVDEALAARLGLNAKRQAEHAIRQSVTQADPAAAAERARHAMEERYASARPAGEGMISFHALLPGLEGQAAWTGLEHRATLMRGVGDERSKEQIKADLLIEALISYLDYLNTTDTGPDDTHNQDPSGTHRLRRPRPAVQIQLVMTDAALFGFSDTPARVHGLGPIPAALARTWVAEAIQEEKAELLRLYTQPGTGQLVGMDSKRRTFPKSLARYVITRDHLCRTPWCGAPIRHIDHVQPHAAGGTTSLNNAQGLCVWCNEHKENPEWKHTPTPNGSGAITITTPTTDTYTTTPEPLPHEAA